jgi:hypothetical protein
VGSVAVKSRALEATMKVPFAASPEFLVRRPRLSFAVHVMKNQLIFERLSAHTRVIIGSYSSIYRLKIESNRLKSAQIGSKSSQIGSNRLKSAQIGSNRLKSRETGQRQKLTIVQTFDDRIVRLVLGMFHCEPRPRTTWASN